MTRDLIQSEALKALIENNGGLVILTMGSGKSKIAIDYIKQSKAKNILITSPRTNLKENWSKELKKWGLKHIDQILPYFGVYSNGNGMINITTENIQTSYKWTKEKIQSFDLIIIDEAHVCFTPEYGKLAIQAKELNIPIIGLTSTPELHKEEKKLFYQKYCPIVYEYYDSVEDGLINKTNYFVYEMRLSDQFQVKVTTKNKTWYEGEKKRYDYIENLFVSSKKYIEDFYLSEIRARVTNINKSTVKDSYKRFFNKIVSKDLEYFRNIYWNSMKRKKLPIDLYKWMRAIASTDYAKFGLKAEYYAKMAPEDVRPYFYKYIWARNARKEFLNNLTSTVNIAKELKSVILAKPSNKILTFSELTNQADKLSQYSIHSNNADDINKDRLESFNKGQIRELSSVRSLQLGLNLNAANWAIFESYNGSPTGAKQSQGRLQRLKVDELANVVIIKVLDTQVDTWFNAAFGFIENPTIVKSISEFNNFLTK